MVLTFLLLAACGGTDPVDPNAGLPKASVTYSATVPVTAVVTLDGSASTAVSGGALTYSWVLTSVPAGSTATIANPTASKATLTPDVVGNYLVTFTVTEGSKSQAVPIGVAAVAFLAPVIQSDLVEPVSGVVNLSLSSNEGTSTINWTVDGVSIGSGATIAWSTTGLADGNHVVVAQVQSAANYVNSLSRTFAVKQTSVSFNLATISETAGTFTAILGAQSPYGIQRLDATLDGVAVGSLAAPNSCVDPTTAICAGTGPYGYVFTGTVASGAHIVIVTATDGVGNQLGTQLLLTVTDVP